MIYKSESLFKKQEKYYNLVKFVDTQVCRYQ